MDYYIQGDAARAKKIKAAFEKLGYDVNNWLFTTGVYYTLNGRMADIGMRKLAVWTLLTNTVIRNGATNLMQLKSQSGFVRVAVIGLRNKNNKFAPNGN